MKYISPIIFILISSILVSFIIAAEISIMENNDAQKEYWQLRTEDLKEDLKWFEEHGSRG